jgi:hypothetical protein
MTNKKAYKFRDSEGCLISGIFTEKELNRFVDAGWSVVEELNPEDYRIGRANP